MIRKYLSILLAIIVFFSLNLSFNISSSKVYSYDGEPFTPSPSPIIAEQFTGAWCVYCPYTSAALEIIQLTRFKIEDFMYLGYHYNDSMANSETTERHKLYKINSWPSIIVAGTNKISPDTTDVNALATGYGDAIERAKSAKRYVADISLDGSLEKNEFYLKILAKEDLRKRNINIVAVIFEDYVNIEGSNGDCFHRYVARNMPYGSNGRIGALKIKEGQIYDETRKFVLASKLKELLGIVVFLQDNETKEIVGSALHRFANKPDSIFYWGKRAESSIIDVNTCQSELIFNVDNTTDLKEIFLKIKPNNEYFEIIGARISPKIGGSNKGTITVDKNLGEVRCVFKEGISGNSELIYLKVFFKKTTEKLKFQIRKFSSTDSNNIQLPFFLLDLNNISYLNVVTNPYDLDSNLSVNSSDMTILISSFGTTKKDKEFNRKCDFNKDSRIDIVDLLDLQIRIEN